MSDQNDLPIAALLTDADWAEVNKLRRVHEIDGSKGLSKAVEKLIKDDPAHFLTIAAAYFPAHVFNDMKDHMADAGITEEDLEEMTRKLQPTKQ
jgi:hypothetical protein